MKVEDREAAVFHSRLQQKVARQKAAKQMASKLLETGSEHWRMSLSLLKKPEECWQVVQSTLSILNKIHQRGSENEILMLCFTNWSAPTVLSAEGQRRQASVMSSLVNRPGSSTLGVLLTPSHSNEERFAVERRGACSWPAQPEQLQFGHSLCPWFPGKA